MAVGLGLLGRGQTSKAVPLWVVHVVAALAAGGVFGAAVGFLGAFLGLDAWRPAVIAVASGMALWLGLRSRPPRLGRQRQVPRRWSAERAVAGVYALWGAMLGCGVWTPVYHTSFVVLVAAQLTADPWLGLVSGALFGGARQAMALVPVIGRYGPPRTMQLLETLRPAARMVNLGLVLVGGFWLILASR